MRIRVVFQCLACAAIVGLGTATARAQNISVFAMGSGSSIFNRTNEVESGGGAGTFSRYQVGGGFTIGSELSFAKIFGVEGSYYLGRNNIIVGFGPGAPTNGIRQQRLSAALVVHAPKSIWRLRPYAAIGPEYDHLAGIGADTPSGFGYGALLSSSNKFGFNYGGGVDLRIARRLALRLDVRNHTFRTPGYGLPYYVYPATGFTQNLVYSLGLVFRL